MDHNLYLPVKNPQTLNNSILFITLHVPEHRSQDCNGNGLRQDEIGSWLMTTEDLACQAVALLKICVILLPTL